MSPYICLSILNHIFGHSAFRGKQEDIIKQVIAGRNCLVLMPTGAGKSLCYQIPAVVRKQAGQGTTIVVSPLIALMQDQVERLNRVGVRAAYLNSSLDSFQKSEVIHNLCAGKLCLLYITPERLMKQKFLELLGRIQIGLFAIDEAHCVSEWGHDFRPEYMHLSVLYKHFPHVPRIALTATADILTRDEIIQRIRLDKSHIFIDSFDRPNIRYQIVQKNNALMQLLEFINSEQCISKHNNTGIVYCMSRQKVEKTVNWLALHGFRVIGYHGGMDTVTRFKHQQQFQQEEGIVMVATIAFGMGVDKPNVRFVAHLDLPKSVEGYYQETGRAGRDGLPADAWMTYSLGDIMQHRRMIIDSNADSIHKRIANKKLDALLNLCETISCRRVHLLSYFGESSKACGNCDTCLNPPITWDGTREAQMALSCVYRVARESGFNFGIRHQIDILRGNASKRVRQHQHENLSTFGIGKALSRNEWHSIFRQLIAFGLLEIEYNGQSSLILTSESLPVLKGERRLMIKHHGITRKKKYADKKWINRKFHFNLK